MPKKVDWNYYRRGWKTCTKTQEFLAEAEITPSVTVDAKKEVHQKTHALELLASVSRLHAARGKKVVVVDLKNADLSEDEILKLVLGPTGNLRAPTLRVGKTLVVGFNEEMYNGILNWSRRLDYLFERDEVYKIHRARHGQPRKRFE